MFCSDYFAYILQILKNAQKYTKFEQILKNSHKNTHKIHKNNSKYFKTQDIKFL